MLPDINLGITKEISSEIAEIGTQDGQAYASTTAVENERNYFFITKYPKWIDCNLLLRSNDPDSTYYLTLILYRLY